MTGSLIDLDLDFDLDSVRVNVDALGNTYSHAIVAVSARFPVGLS